MSYGMRDEDRDRDRYVITDNLSEEREWHTAETVITGNLSQTRLK